MNKPYIVCYMMTSVDGRIDCTMTGQLPGVEEYYPLLEELHLENAVSGKTTALLELAEPGTFEAKDKTPVGKEEVYRAVESTSGYDIVVDSKGSLLWKADCEYSKPHVIITSTQVSREYLDYLKEKQMSYIVAGDDQTDLAQAVEILKEHFGAERLGVVGGPTINTAFLDAGLLDEVIILIGAGIDGRAAFQPVFNRQKDNEDGVTKLNLLSVDTYESGAVCIRYSTKA